MIKAILVVNNHGKARVTKFYEHLGVERQQSLVSEVFSLVSSRSDQVCNFVEDPSVLGSDTKVVYRIYATLYFIFIVDDSESELGILDLIHVLVESLDHVFENVCELDLIFHTDKVHYIVDEIVMGGMVLETNLHEILNCVRDQEDLESKSDRAVSAKSKTGGLALRR